MKPSTPLIVAAVALLAPAMIPASPASAQEYDLRRDVPAPVARECDTAADSRTPGSTPQDPTQAARLVASAREAALLGDPVAARDFLAQAARADTAAANVAFLLARTLEELGSIDDAVREYCRYVQLAGDAPDAGEVRTLVRRIAPPIRLGIPDSAVARFHTALALADSGRDIEAEGAFSDVIAAAPSWAAPYYNRALLRRRDGRGAAARSDLEQFLALEPGGPAEAHVRAWLASPVAPFRNYSTGAAFAYGLIPGGGHFYTGRPVSGATVLVVAGGAAAFGVLYQKRHIDCLTIPQDNVCPPDQVRAERTERPYLLPAAGVAAVVTVIGALDAVRGARRYNAQGAASDSESRVGSAVTVRPSRVDVALFRLRF